MDYIELGNTGIKVSRLCFGGLIIGPLQANMSVEEGARVIADAFEMGVNFIDTAELYGTYPHIREAIRISKFKPVVASKSYAYSKESARDSVEKARREMDIDVLDIFLLHEQESRLTLRGHKDALDYYLEQKEKGIIKAVGVSTHNVEVVDAAADMPEIDVIHPIVNKAGLGIGDGTIDEMLAAVRKAFEAGKGIYSMKPLGGGNLLRSFDECLEFVLKLPFIHSIALGMQSLEEVRMNVSIFNNQEVSENIRYALINKKRILHIDYWCNGCGNCVNRCRQKALKVADGKAEVDMDKCVLCGYCSGVCTMFAIKIR
ncbi:MAG TPA: aldo/keto reductase [Pseudobacteroides sp.]|uniref:aldo/keto reductase n=1 Tax=Pseudobacteroides sp. TaxID=1968840 RepID=UPI002F93FFE6